MSRLFYLVLCVTCVGWANPAAAQSATPKRFKNEALKRGALTTDPAAGYVLIRASAKSPPIGLWRQPPDGADRYPPEMVKNKDLRDTFGALTNPGRSWEDRDNLSAYVLKLYPGRYVISTVGGTCMSMGTYAFDVQAGSVVDVGTVLTAKEDGKSPLPEFARSRLSQDLVDFGVATNIVMSHAMFSKPPSGLPVPHGLEGVNVTPANLKADVRLDNICRTLTNRAASLPPPGHRPPMSTREAAAHIAARKAQEEEEERLSR